MILKVNTTLPENVLKDMQDKFNKFMKEPCLVIPQNIEVVPENNLRVVTKQEFVINLIDVCMKKEDIDKEWDMISRGYNFIFMNSEGRYISVDYLNNMLGDRNG
ncbi:hypothetical protein [Clostridium sp. UBA3887]|uniref:hypothetical protein n=1 Tax=Clostridium sp. UBA3887 TaxID=1946356 RepID=UPI003217190A